VRILIISDAWHPQVNGVVRTLTMLQQELTELGHLVEVIGPGRFRTMAMPSYRSIPLAVAPSACLLPMIEAFQPEALHIATEGPLGAHAERFSWRTCAELFFSNLPSRFIPGLLDRDCSRSARLWCAPGWRARKPKT